VDHSRGPRTRILSPDIVAAAAAAAAAAAHNTPSTVTTLTLKTPVTQPCCTVVNVKNEEVFSIVTQLARRGIHLCFTVLPKLVDSRTPLDLTTDPPILGHVIIVSG